MSRTDVEQTAWNIHATLCDWIGKVDIKATFALTMESALLAGIVALVQSGQFEHLHSGVGVATLWGGVILLSLGIGAAMLAVIPRTRSRAVANEWKSNFIYFGHLRNWDPQELVDEIRTQDPMPVLCRQLVVMSKIAWQKHRRLQQSFVLAALSLILVFLAGTFLH